MKLIGSLPFDYSIANFNDPERKKAFENIVGKKVLGSYLPTIPKFWRQRLFLSTVGQHEPWLLQCSLLYKKQKSWFPITVLIIFKFFVCDFFSVW